MSQSYTMAAPEVQASMTGKVPKYMYTARATKVKAEIDRHATKQYNRTIINCEIVAPDVVEDAANPDRPKYAVAGRRFSLYLPIDPVSKQYADSYNAFVALGYRKADGSIDLEQFWADANAGTLFFRVELDSEEDLVKDGAGQPIPGPDGKNITRGWQIKFVQPNNVLGRAEMGTPNPTVSGPF